MNSVINDKTQNLVVLAQRGDESAREQLCKTYGPRILWLVRMRMGKELRTRLESVDLVQDVLYSTFKDLQNFTYKNEGDFIRWISRITENRLCDNLNRLHADKRDIRKEIQLDNNSPTLADSLAAAMEPIDITTPSGIVSKREDFEKLVRAIDSLKPEYRDVIVLTKVEGLCYKEIADKLGKSVDAVRMLFYRAMAALTGAFEAA